MWKNLARGPHNEAEQTKDLNTGPLRNANTKFCVHIGKYINILMSTYIHMYSYLCDKEGTGESESIIMKFI